MPALTPHTHTPSILTPHTLHTTNPHRLHPGAPPVVGVGAVGPGWQRHAHVGGLCHASARPEGACLGPCMRRAGALGWRCCAGTQPESAGGPGAMHTRACCCAGARPQGISLWSECALHCTASRGLGYKQQCPCTAPGPTAACTFPRAIAGRQHCACVHHGSGVLHGGRCVLMHAYFQFPASFVSSFLFAPWFTPCHALLQRHVLSLLSQTGVAAGLLALGEALPTAPGLRAVRLASWAALALGVAGLAGGWVRGGQAPASF